MGQTESTQGSDADAGKPSESRNDVAKAEKTPEPEEASPLEALIAEATAYSGSENESLEVKAQKALECPCVADLRRGPCGGQFTEAFLCFMKSTAAEKGSDCVHPFVALQDCIKEYPDAFSKDVLEEEEDNEKVDEEAQSYKIIPPTWARETKSNM